MANGQWDHRNALEMLLLTELNVNALCCIASGSFKLCHFETGHTLVLEPGAQYESGVAVMVVTDRDAGILWYLDESTSTLKTQINHLCIHQREGSLHTFSARHNNTSFSNNGHDDVMTCQR